MKDKILAELTKKSPILLTELHHAVGQSGLPFVLALHELKDEEKVQTTYHGVDMDGKIDPVGYDEPTGIPDAGNLHDIVTMVAIR